MTLDLVSKASKLASKGDQEIRYVIVAVVFGKIFSRFPGSKLSTWNQYDYVAFYAEGTSSANRFTDVTDSRELLAIPL